MNLIYNNTTYSIPESWQEVSIRQFQSLNLIDKKQDEIDLTLRIIESITGISFEDLEQLPASEFKKLQSVTQYLTTDIKRDLKYRFTFNGVEYGLDHNPSKMSTRAFLDAEVLTHDNDSVVSNMHLIMSVLYRPITKITNPNNKLGFEIEPYHTEDLEERGELFLGAPIEIAMAAFFFIGLYSIKLFQATQDSSPKQKQTQTKKKTSKKK